MFPRKVKDVLPCFNPSQRNILPLASWKWSLLHVYSLTSLRATSLILPDYHRSSITFTDLLFLNVGGRRKATLIFFMKFNIVYCVISSTAWWKCHNADDKDIAYSQNEYDYTILHDGNVHVVVTWPPFHASLVRPAWTPNQPLYSLLSVNKFFQLCRWLVRWGTSQTTADKEYGDLILAGVLQ